MVSVTMQAERPEPARRGFTPRWEILLPAIGVVAGMLLILGPFLATIIRSLLYWDASGVSLSLANFVGLFNDSRFYQAVGNTLIAGTGATIVSCLLGFSLA